MSGKAEDDITLGWFGKHGVSFLSIILELLIEQTHVTMNLHFLKILMILISEILRTYTKSLYSVKAICFRKKDISFMF